MKIYKYLLCLFVLLTQISFANDHDHDHDHDHIKAKYGGEILEVGEHLAFIEVVHNEAAGKLTLHISDKEGKTLTLNDSPRLNLTDLMSKKRKQLITQSIQIVKDKSTAYESNDKIFKSEEFELVISLKINQKYYRVKVEHDHDHKH